MHCSTNSVPISSVSNPKNTVSPSCPPSTQLNHVTTKKSAKRNQKSALKQQTPISPLQLNNQASKSQTIDSSTVVEHSRSRDKSRRLPKTKGKKKQTKGKRAKQQIIVNNPTSILEYQVLISDSLTLQSSKLPVQEPIHQGNIPTEDNHEVNPIVQKQVGKLIDNASTVDVSTATNVKDSPKMDLLPPNLPIQTFPQPVYQGWQSNVQQVVKQSKEALEEQKIKNEKPQEDTKEKEISQNLIPSEKLPNERSQKRTNYDRQRYKTKLCYDFLKGKCKRITSQCTYAHGYDDMKSQCKIKFVCRNYTRGICKKPQEECKFYHQRRKDIDSFTFSENSNCSDQQRKQQFKTDLTQGRRGENRQEKRPDQRQQKRQERREQRFSQRTQDKRSQERKADKVQDQKNYKRSLQRAQDSILEKQSVRREENKKYAQSQQNANIYDINSAYMSPYSYFPLNNGYVPPNNFSQQYNRPQEMVYGFQNNMQSGYPPYYAPANYPPYYPIHQQNPVLLSQIPNSNYNPPSNPQFINQNRTNLTNMQPIPAPMHPNYSMQNPAEFHQFYPWFPQYSNYQGNDRLASQMPKSENFLNGNSQEKEIYRNRESRNQSRSRSRDRKEKRNHRR